MGAEEEEEEEEEEEDGVASAFPKRTVINRDEFSPLAAASNLFLLT